MSDTTYHVTISRQINAPASAIFAVLCDPTRHPTFDGSEMLIESITDAPLSAVGDVFSMHMENERLGKYDMENRVVEYEQDRRIMWEPYPKDRTPEEVADMGGLPQHLWGFTLDEENGTTTVTEIFDCSSSPDWLKEATDNGKNWVPAMTASLERLDKLVTS